MKIGITGAGGFVGGHLARALAARGAELRLMVHSRRGAAELEKDLAEPIAAGRVEVVEAELRGGVSQGGGAGLEDFATGLDAVIHSGGLTRAARPLDFWRVNRGGTRALVEALRRGSPALKRLLVISSFAVHGPSSGPADFAREDDPLRPLTPYGRSKKAMEAYLRREASDLPWTLLRPVPVYGPRDRDFLPIFRAAALGLGFGFSRESRASMIYVDNLVELALLALEAPAAVHETLHACDDESLSQAEILARVGETLGRRVLFLPLPQGLARLAALASEALAGLRGRAPLLTRHKLRELSSPWWLASNERAKTLLDWKPRVPPKEAFAATLAWYRGRGLL